MHILRQAHRLSRDIQLREHVDVSIIALFCIIDSRVQSDGVHAAILNVTLCGEPLLDILLGNGQVHLSQRLDSLIRHGIECVIGNFIAVFAARISELFGFVEILMVPLLIHIIRPVWAARLLILIYVCGIFLIDVLYTQLLQI